MHDVLAKNYKDFHDVDVPIGEFMNAIAKDKKNVGKGEVTLILPNNEAKIEIGCYPNDSSFLNLCQKYLTEIRFQ